MSDYLAEAHFRHAPRTFERCYHVCGGNPFARSVAYQLQRCRNLWVVAAGGARRCAADDACGAKREANRLPPVPMRDNLFERSRGEFSGQQEVGLDAGEGWRRAFADRREVVNSADRDLPRNVQSILRGGSQHLCRDAVVRGEYPTGPWKLRDPAVQRLLPYDALRGMPSAGERLARQAVQGQGILEPAFAVVAPESRLWVGDECEAVEPRQKQLLCGETARGDGIMADAVRVRRKGARVAVEIDRRQEVEEVCGDFLISAAAFRDCADWMPEVDQLLKGASGRNSVHDLYMPVCRGGMAPDAGNLVWRTCLRRRLEVEYCVHAER